jgi:hypothetical protein
VLGKSQIYSWLPVRSQVMVDMFDILLGLSLVFSLHLCSIMKSLAMLSCLELPNPTPHKTLVQSMEELTTLGLLFLSSSLAL